jgi:DNA-binding MarR family transcriptional regulator
VAHTYQDQLLGERDEFMINTGAERPIGYWLKKLNNLIDAEFERQLGEASLSRQQWQVLNLLADGPRSVPELESELAPFLRDAPEDLGEAQDLRHALSGLVMRGWVDSMENIVILTESGQAQFELLKARVAELRQALTAGISAEEYQATIDVLSRMTENLESRGKTVPKPIRNQEASVGKPHLA